MAHRIKYLRDTFSSLGLNVSLWTVTGPGMLYYDGKVQFEPGTEYTVLESVHSYSLTQSEVSAYVGLLGSGQTRELTMECRIDASNGVAISCVNDTLTFRVRVAGVNSDISIPVDRDAMTHWRIEERSGIIYFYTSDNYASWTQQRVATHGLDLSLVKLRFSCGLNVDADFDEYGDGEYGEGFYGGVSGAAPDFAFLYSVNREDPIPSTVPAVVSVLRAAGWRWAIGPWRDSAASHELLYAGARSLQLHLNTPSEAQFTTWGQADEALHLEEGISDLWVTRDADTLFRGRVIRANDRIDGSSHAVNVSCVDYRGILDRRNLNADVTFTAVDQATIVRSLIETAQAETGGYHGIKFFEGDVDDWATTGVTRTVEFKEGQSFWECIAKLCAMEGGFDAEIDENKLFNLHFPRSGQDTGEVLDYEGNVTEADRTLNMDSYGNAVRQSGADGVASSTQYSDNIANAPEGRWDLQYGDIDLTTSDMVVKTALARVGQSSQLLPTYRLSMGTGMWRGPGHVWLGDYVYVVVKSGRLNDVIKMRVFDLDIDVDINNNEKVSITVGDPKLTVASMLNRINRNIRSLQRM